MFWEHTTVTVLGVIHIGLVLPCELLKVTSLPNIELPAVTALQNVYHVARVAIEKSTIFPTEFVVFTKSKTLACSEESTPVVFAPTTVKQTCMPCSVFFFTSENLEGIKWWQRDLGCRVLKITGQSLKAQRIVSPFRSLKMFLMRALG